MTELLTKLIKMKNSQINTNLKYEYKLLVYE